MLAEPSADPLVGSPVPRIGPPRPLRSDIAGFRDEAACLGVHLYPWQDNVGHYLNALNADGNWLYPEVANVVARQNGKTEILVPHICSRLRMGRRIMHTAQNRELPREVYRRVADHMVAKHASELARMPRFSNGQEEIRLLNGWGLPDRRSQPGRRSWRDERRPRDRRGPRAGLVGHDVARSARRSTPRPTRRRSTCPTRATNSSLVLNALRLRASEDPTLAYLEWSRVTGAEVRRRRGLDRVEPVDRAHAPDHRQPRARLPLPPARRDDGDLRDGAPVPVGRVDARTPRRRLRLERVPRPRRRPSAAPVHGRVDGPQGEARIGGPRVAHPRRGGRPPARARGDREPDRHGRASGPTFASSPGCRASSMSGTT